jgi:hypothetical protein
MPMVELVERASLFAIWLTILKSSRKMPPCECSAETTDEDGVVGSGAAVMVVRGKRGR